MGGNRDPLTVDEQIAKVAAAQHGVIARHQLHELGIGQDAIDGRLAAARLHRIHRGVYAVGHIKLTGNGRYLAAVLACGPGAALSHRSAGDHLGIRPTTGRRIEVIVPTHAGRRGRAGITLHRCRSLLPAEVTVVDGISTTTPARTLLDLAGALRPQQLERAIDRAEALRIFDLRALRACMAAHPRQRGLTALLSILDKRLEPAFTRNDLEDCFLGLCTAAGLPRPKVNVQVEGFEVDFFWPEQRLIVETDGRATHGTRTAFEHDRARDARLTAAGYRVVRFSYRQVVYEPEFVAATLRALLGYERAAAR